jgi:hypothetical protein
MVTNRIPNQFGSDFATRWKFERGCTLRKPVEQRLKAFVQPERAARF